MSFPPLERFGGSAARRLASARARSSLAIDPPCGLVWSLGTLPDRGATRARTWFVGRSLHGSLALGLFSLRGSSSRAPHGPATPRPVKGSPGPEIPLEPRVGWFPGDRDVFPSAAACRRIPGRGLGESGSRAGFFGADLVQRGEEIPEMPVAQGVGPAGRRGRERAFLGSRVGASSDRRSNPLLPRQDQFLVGSLEFAGPHAPSSPGKTIIDHRWIIEFGHIRSQRDARPSSRRKGWAPHRGMGRRARGVGKRPPPRDDIGNHSVPLRSGREHPSGTLGPKLPRPFDTVPADPVRTERGVGCQVANVA